MWESLQVRGSSSERLFKFAPRGEAKDAGKRVTPNDAKPGHCHPHRIGRLHRTTWSRIEIGIKNGKLHFSPDTDLLTIINHYLLIL